jgi:F-type H+-transporting ATPase subunit alpha
LKQGLCRLWKQKYSGILDAIRNEQKISDETEADLRKALEDFKASFAG